jgi:hypothetical protein
MAVRLVALVLLTHVIPVAADAVRTPRDSPIPFRGHIQAPAVVNRSTAASTGPHLGRSTSLCGGHVFPDPGYRPMWIPETTCWTGFETIRVPGHWQDR